jgi:CxxC motif-containing protein (DUF1111 family)
MTRTNTLATLLKLLGIILIISSCQKILPGEPAENQLLDGPVEELTFEQGSRFSRGDAIFNDKIFTAQTGLGPIFVATSCGSCHPGDGKGHPFTSLIRFGQADSIGNKYLEQGGPQLQNRALPGYQPEVLPAGAPYSSFIPPIVTGLGFLDLVSDADILAMAEENKNNLDGIRGRPNWITIPAYVKPRKNAIRRSDGKYISRFGLKASVYDLLQQTVDALNQDIGISSIFDPIDQWSGLPIEPEITSTEIHELVFYLQTLKAPLQRDNGELSIMKGNALFKEIGCESCHRETLRTGPSAVSALNQVEFHPYTDLLLHDMGPELDDGYTEGIAKSSEWRTAPLWGLGLAKDSQGGKYYLLHDGRARSIEEAIALHGGEASKSRERYKNLSNDEQNKLIQFLESL